MTTISNLILYLEKLEQDKNENSKIKNEINPALTKLKQIVSEILEISRKEQERKELFSSIEKNNLNQKIQDLSQSIEIISYLLESFLWWNEYLDTLKKLWFTLLDNNKIFFKISCWRIYLGNFFDEKLSNNPITEIINTLNEANLLLKRLSLLIDTINIPLNNENDSLNYENNINEIHEVSRELENIYEKLFLWERIKNDFFLSNYTEAQIYINDNNILWDDKKIKGDFNLSWTDFLTLDQKIIQKYDNLEFFIRRFKKFLNAPKYTIENTIDNIVFNIEFENFKKNISEELVDFIVYKHLKDIQNRFDLFYKDFYDFMQTNKKICISNLYYLELPIKLDSPINFTHNKTKLKLDTSENIKQNLDLIASEIQEISKTFPLWEKIEKILWLWEKDYIRDVPSVSQ